MIDQDQISDPLPEAAGRRQRSKHEKLGRIRAAAQRLFARQGFEATTTRQIAEEADIGTGTLFLYAKSKEELLVMVFQEDMVRIRDEAFASLPKRANLLDEIFHVYRVMSEFHERDRALGRVYAKEMAFVREPNRQGLHDFMNGIYSLTERRVEAAKTRGEFADHIPSRMLARNLFALYFSLLQSGLAEDVSLVSAEHLGLLRESLALQLQGLAAES